MAFNRNEFIRDARQQGYSSEVINEALSGGGYKPVSFGEETLYKLPTYGGAAGLAAGLPAGVSPASAFAGYGAGTGLRALIEAATGRPQTMTTEKFMRGEPFTEAGGWGMLGMLPYLWPPYAKSQMFKKIEAPTKKRPEVIPFGDLATATKKLVEGGAATRRPELRKGVEAGLAEIVGQLPKTKAPLKTISGAEMLTERTALSKAPIWGTTPEKAEAGRILQKGLSEQLHQVYPEMKTPDWMYGQHAKLLKLLRTPLAVAERLALWRTIGGIGR